MYEILECSSAGEKKLSAFWAVVTVFGVKDTIEKHYQGAKGFNTPTQDTKGKHPDFAIINGEKVDSLYLIGFYYYMWVLYLDANPELVAEASKYEDFSDRFRSKNAKVCQADVIREYIKKGRESVLMNVSVRLFKKKFNL